MTPFPPYHPDSATDTLLSSLSSTMDLLCPLSTIHKKNSSPAPWLSDVLRNNRRELRSAARKWKKSKLDTDLISYRMLLSKFSLDVTSAKTSFYKEKLETSAQDPRKLHNIFLSLLNPPAPPSPSSLTAEDHVSPKFIYTTQSALCYSFTDAALKCSSRRGFANYLVLQSYHLPTGSNHLQLCFRPSHLTSYPSSLQSSMDP
ncbi:hypothetical protein QTP86_009936 [Hemibagrus guttatus]|nr:hypothetical protein QTP86_009936 [Hemibagrus guttatus]